MTPLVSLCYCLFFLTAQWSHIAGAIPIEDDSAVLLRSDTIPSADIEERQASLVVVGAAIALGILGARWAARSNNDVALNKKPGTACFESGSWTKQDRILTDMVPTICSDLVPRALTWQKDSDLEPNPFLAPTQYTSGAYLLNEDGFRQSLAFGMIDENGEKGKDFYTQEACVTAFTAILHDCMGSHSDTRGGVHLFGNNGVAGFYLDPTCVGSPDKKCGSNT
ncbi:MAG: hypothetical protein M1812_000051 [Candelaria pacifica]|nr:MAG: hypothetical protein M1812_000051 [Candelaria pacifica]